jgi:hypothetical protein
VSRRLKLRTRAPKPHQRDGRTWEENEVGTTERPLRVVVGYYDDKITMPELQVLQATAQAIAKEGPPGTLACLLPKGTKFEVWEEQVSP